MTSKLSLQIGDNLSLLKTLADESIDVVYTDPPYNTGNSVLSGFSYRDTFPSHGDWLDFMAPRLREIKRVMANDGVLMISIDDRELHYLKILCDEIFGGNNFIAQLVWDGGTRKNSASFFSISHEYVLVYSKSKNKLSASGRKFREIKVGADLLLDKFRTLKKDGFSDPEISVALKKWVKTAPLPKRVKVFTLVDHKGLYTYADLSAPGNNGKLYDVVHPVTKLPCSLPTRGWGISEEAMQDLLAQDLVIFGDSHTKQPMRKLYFQDALNQAPGGILDYPARSSAHLLKAILGKHQPFNNPKNLSMVRHLLEISVFPGARVLDPFAGSGTTGHAVMEINADKKLDLSCTLFNIDESNIVDEVLVPRLKALETGTWSSGTEIPLPGKWDISR